MRPEELLPFMSPRVRARQPILTSPPLTMGDLMKRLQPQPQPGPSATEIFEHAGRMLFGYPEKILTGEREQLDTPFGSVIYPSGAPDAAAMLPLGANMARRVVQSAGEEAVPFFSRLMRTIEERMPERAAPEQVLNIARKGSKAEELAWSGLEDMMRGKKTVSRDEVLRHLEANAPQLREQFIPPKPTEVINGQPYYSARDITPSQSHQPKFTQYTLPSGENHRELVVTMPHKLADIPSFEEYSKHFPEPPTREQYDKYVRAAQENQAKGGGREGYQVPTGHAYGDPELDVNRLFHARMNDRTTAEGERALHLEELQSDWHQAGAAQGYATSPKPLDATSPLTDQEKLNLADLIKDDIDDDTIFEQLRSDYPEDVSDEDIQDEINSWGRSDRREFALDHYVDTFELLEAREMLYGDGTESGKANGVPDAPFKNTWHELGMKRMIQEAAEGGYDRLTWTTGAQQRARWNKELQEHVDKLTWNGTHLGVWKNGEQIQTLTPSNLSEYVGKEMADKLEAARPNTAREVTFPMGQKVRRITDDDDLYEIGVSTGALPRRGDWALFNNRGRALSVAAGDQFSEAEARQQLHANVHFGETGPVKGVAELSGLDIDVGDKFMKTLYDQKLKQFADKFGKKYGVKSELAELPFKLDSYVLPGDETPLTDRQLDEYIDEERQNYEQIMHEDINDMRTREELGEYLGLSEHELEEGGRYGDLDEEDLRKWIREEAGNDEDQLTLAHDALNPNDMEKKLFEGSEAVDKVHWLDAKMNHASRDHLVSVLKALGEDEEDFVPGGEFGDYDLHHLRGMAHDQVSDDRSSRDIINELLDAGVIERASQTHEVWSLKITPQMREDLKREGQPLFSASPIPVPPMQRKDDKKSNVRPPFRLTGQ